MFFILESSLIKWKNEKYFKNQSMMLKTPNIAKLQIMSETPNDVKEIHMKSKSVIDVTKNISFEMKNNLKYNISQITSVC